MKHFIKHNRQFQYLACYAFFVLTGCLVFTSCSPVLSFVLGIRKMKPESLQEQVRYLRKYHLDTTHLYNFNLAYNDSLNTPAYALEDYNGKIKDSSHSIIQYRVFNSDGTSAGGFAICFGSAERIGVFDSMPPIIRHYSNLGLTLAKDTMMLIPLRGNYILPAGELDKYDYVIIAFWSRWLGYLSRHQLSMLEDYIHRHPEKKFLLLKVDWGDLEAN